MPDLLLAGPSRFNRPDHLGDDIPGATDHHLVADPYILAMYLVLVVEGGHADVGATNEDRLEDRERGRPTGPPNVDLDVVEPRDLLFRRELVRDRPARRLGGEAEFNLIGERVNLDDDTIGLVLLVVARLFCRRDVPLDRREIGDRLRRRVDAESKRAQVVERLRVARERWPALNVAQLVDPDRQVALRGHRRVLLAQGTSGCVPGVDEDLLAGRGLALVEGIERR